MSLIDPIGLPKGRAGQYLVDGVADGYEAFALAAAALEVAPDAPLIFVARDGQRLPSIMEALAFAAPELRFSNSRPGTAFPTTACRRGRTRRRAGWRPCSAWSRSGTRRIGRSC